MVQYWSPLFVASILLLFKKTGIFSSLFFLWREAAGESPQKYSCQQLWSPTCFCTHIEKRTKKFTQIVVCTTNLTTLNTYTIVWSKESWKPKKKEYNTFWPIRNNVGLNLIYGFRFWSCLKFRFWWKNLGELCIYLYT